MSILIMMERATGAWQSSRLALNSNEVSQVLKLNLSLLQKCYDDSFEIIDKGTIIC